VRLRVAQLSLLLAWICANGAIWDAVQVFAWSKMFVGYTSTMTVPAALRETFDPSKPCDMCLGVASARETAKQQLPQSVEHSTEKLLLALHTSASVVFNTTPGDWPVTLSREAESRSESVPVPPPRV
jgi:hypothetical protein